MAGAPQKMALAGLRSAVSSLRSLPSLPPSYPGISVPPSAVTHHTTGAILCTLAGSAIPAKPGVSEPTQAPVAKLWLGRNVSSLPSSWLRESLLSSLCWSCVGGYTVPSTAPGFRGAVHRAAPSGSVTPAVRALGVYE